MAKQLLISFYRIIDENIEIMRVIRGDRTLHGRKRTAPNFMASIGVCVRDLELIAKVSDLEDFTNHIQYPPL